MILPDYMHEATETIDAALFSGDTFHTDAERRTELRRLMARWERELKTIEAYVAEADEDTKS